MRNHKAHGFAGTRLYRVWNSMRDRCNRPKSKAYKNYGGRGISVCSEWDSFLTFRNWALSNGYDENAKYMECTLDRIDTNGNYSPENCKWSNWSQQQSNTRRTHNITYNGKTQCLTRWCEEYGINFQTMLHRLYKMKLPFEVAINMPVKTCGRRLK